MQRLFLLNALKAKVEGEKVANFEGVEEAFEVVA
jgi:hypothetical protein